MWAGVLRVEVGDQGSDHPTYGIAKRLWDVSVGGLPVPHMRGDDVDGAGRVTTQEVADGDAEGNRGDGAIELEATFLGEPGGEEEVESLDEAMLWMGIEVGLVPEGGLGGAALLSGSTGPRAVSGPSAVRSLVHVAHDGGEVAVAEAGDAATGMGTEAALGLAQILKRVATEGADE